MAEVEIDVEDEEEEVVITGEVENNDEPVRKRRKLVLDEKLVNIYGNEMITDEAINIAENLLHKQFVDISGFMDTSLALAIEFLFQSKNPLYRSSTLVAYTGYVFQTWKRLNELQKAS